MRIGVLGGTGPAGTALVVRLASVGYEVIIGSRSAERAESMKAELLERWPDQNLPLSAGDNAAAADAELVVIATPWDAAADTALSVAELLTGKVVVCMCNALTRMGRDMTPLIPPRGSVTAQVQAVLPASQVVAAFQHVPAHELGVITDPVDCDVLVCSDHPAAADAVCDVIGRIPGLRGLNAGLLSNALAVEALTAVLINLNIRYKSRAAVRFTGIP